MQDGHKQERAYVRFAMWISVLSVFFLSNLFVDGLLTTSRQGAWAAQRSKATARGLQNVPLPANPNEQILILFTNDASVGLYEPGFFDIDGRPYFHILGRLGSLDGSVTGHYEAVSGAENGTFNSFLTYPLPGEGPQPPFDKPPRQPWNPRTNWQMVRWILHGRGELWGVGQSVSKAVVNKDPLVTELQVGGFVFITGGTGEFENTRGTAVTVNSIDLTVPPQPEEGGEDPAYKGARPGYLIHVLKLMHNTEERPITPFPGLVDPEQPRR